MDTYNKFKLTNKAYGVSDKSGSRVSERLINSPEEFLNFQENGKNNVDNGAVLVITGKQYIFAVNDNGGSQGHVFSFAKAYLEMEDKYSDMSFTEACKISSYRESNYLTFSVEAENGSSNTPIYRAFRTIIYGPISRSEYQSFKAFYDVYAPIFRKQPFFYYVFSKPKKTNIPIKSIDELSLYLESIIDEKKVAYEYEKGEKIIGVPTNTESIEYSL